jgi:hypothetical protein
MNIPTREAKVLARFAHPMYEAARRTGQARMEIMLRRFIDNAVLQLPISDQDPIGQGLRVLYEKELRDDRVG